MATRSEFAKFMVTLGAAMPRFAPNTGDKNTLEVWYGELGGLDVETLGVIYKRAVSNFDQFPSIRQLLDLAGKTEQSDEDKAREVGERIWGAICKHGSLRINLEEVLGPIGAEVVKIQGGWQSICDIATYDNGPTLKAQWRGLAEVLIRKGASSLHQLPDFREASTLISNIPVLDVAKEFGSKP